MNRSTPRLAFVLLAGLAVVSGSDLKAYLKLGSRISSGIVQIKWTPGQMPIRYSVTNRDVSGVSALQLQQALERAFSVWTSVPTATISAQFVGFTGAEPGADDQTSVIGFRLRPDLDRVLGSTSFKLDENSGAVIESDIFLNSAVNWSVASGGEASRYDVESISVHEIGHLLGLGHSALGETELLAGGRSIRGKRAVMFPIAYPQGNIEDRTLEADDVAGISDVYPTTSFTSDTGAISGRVTRSGAGGIFGAHVTAFNLSSGTLTGGFSLNQSGDFVIGGLVPGLYVVRAEPLDDAEVSLFFDEETIVPINFRPAYFERLVAVPAGGTSGTIEIRVQSK
ncbi:MAG TPA: matrixin family metalloprotease [Vicinamibacterales bacterium]|nr:matrixin family metalloprotease [Vicinamibacterales bacterium]